MIKKLALSTAVAVTAIAAMPTAAQAQSRYGYYDARYSNHQNQYRRYDRRYNNRRYYDRRGYNQRYYGNRYCRDSGTTGTIVGAIAGGLLGREIAGRGDRTVGTIIGGAAGALLGREIDRDGNCRR